MLSGGPRATIPRILGNAILNESAQRVSIQEQRPLKADLVHRPRALSSDKSPFREREMAICRIVTVSLDLEGPMKNADEGACQICPLPKDWNGYPLFDGCSVLLPDHIEE